MKANVAGRIVEDALAGFMTACALRFRRQVVVGRSIYGAELRADFVIENLRCYPGGLAVESKWQNVGGSVDEKFPYLVENIQQQYLMPAMVVIHGGGCRPGAAAWLRTRVDGARLVAVIDLEDFFRWAMRADRAELVR